MVRGEAEPIRGARGWVRVGWLACLIGWRLAAGTFEVGLDRESIEAGGTAVLVLSFSDFGEVEAPAPPAVPGATLQYLGASSQTSLAIENGRRTQHATIQHRYGITPKAEGTLTIPAFTVTIAGQQFTSQSMQLTVGKAVDAVAFARLQLVSPTNTLYVGQPFVAHLQFLFNRSPAQVGVPQLPTDGFVAGRTVKVVSSQQRIAGEIWGIYDSPIVLAPARAGELSLGPAEIETVFSVAPKRGGLFGDFFAEQRRYTFKSGSNSVTVIEPPVAGRPADYHGAIGRFSLRVDAKPTTVTVGDPIALRVMVDGQGGLDALVLTEFASDSGFRTYSGTNGVQVRDQFGFVGTKTFELVVVPERADLTTLTLPRLVSFDPDSKTYLVAEASPISLTVKPGVGVQAAPSVVPSYGPISSNSVPAGEGIQLRPATFGAGQTGLLAPLWAYQRWYWVALALPTLGWAGLVIGAMVARRRATDPRKATRILAAGRVQVARQQLGTATGPAFYETLDQVLREQIGLVTDLPPVAIVADVIDRRLVPQGLTEVEAGRLRHLFDAVGSARFGPLSSTRDEVQLREEAAQALADLRRLEDRS